MKKLEFRDYLAITVCFLIFIIIGILLFVPIPDNNKEVMYSVGGGLLAALSLILGYYFGSSHGSSKKDDTIASLRDNSVK